MSNDYDPALEQLARIDDPIERQGAVRTYLASSNGQHAGIPDLCNADVLQLATMWDRALKCSGLDVRAWRAYRWRLDQLVDRDEPWTFYSDPTGFWDVTDQLAFRIANPSTCVRNGANVEQGADGHVSVTGSTDYVDMWVALKEFFSKRRGYDLAGKMRIPRTTNADALQLVQIWDEGAARARTDVFGVTGAKAAWKEVSDTVKAKTEGADPADTYADNLTLWRVSQRLTIRIQVAAEEPPDVDFVDALSSNIQKLPERLKAVGEWVVDEVEGVASGAADKAGDVASGAGKAIARGLGPIMKPLAIGVGVLGAAIITSKLIEKRRTRRAG